MWDTAAMQVCVWYSACETPPAGSWSTIGVCSVFSWLLWLTVKLLNVGNIVDFLETVYQIAFVNMIISEQCKSDRRSWSQMVEIRAANSWREIAEEWSKSEAHFGTARTRREMFGVLFKKKENINWIHIYTYFVFPKRIFTYLSHSSLSILTTT